MKKALWLVLLIVLGFNISCAGPGLSEPEPVIQEYETGDASPETFSVRNGTDTVSYDETDRDVEKLETENDENGVFLLDDFPVQCQYPELPTGCEVTSLSMVLQYFGFQADKCDLADNYLDKGPVGSVNFREAFEGDPRDDSSYGCYAPVLVNAANRYLQQQNSDLIASEYNGLSIEELLDFVDAGVPVIVWGTLDCQEGHYSVTWVVDGESLTWFTPEHCMVLIGYDQYQVWVADPVHGDIRPYERNLFESRYDSLYRQVVVIQ